MIAQRNEQVERELEKLVGVLVDVVPQLTEVRVFGSYNNGNWNPEKSDVDVFIETGDEAYAALDAEDIRQFTRRRALKTITMKKIVALSERYETIFDLEFYTMGEIKRTFEVIDVRGSLAKNMKSGRLLYPIKQIPIVN